MDFSFILHWLQRVLYFILLQQALLFPCGSVHRKGLQGGSEDAWSFQGEAQAGPRHQGNVEGPLRGLRAAKASSCA